jgi:hypothetical protein
MGILDEYLNRADDIIGDRTKEEIQYDNAVLKELRKGKKIKKAIEKANKKFPNEAMTIDADSINDVAAHYEYQLEHEKIMAKLKDNR